MGQSVRGREPAIIKAAGCLRSFGVGWMGVVKTACSQSLAGALLLRVLMRAVRQARMNLSGPATNHRFEFVRWPTYFSLSALLGFLKISPTESHKFERRETRTLAAALPASGSRARPTKADRTAQRNRPAAWRE